MPYFSNINPLLDRLFAEKVVVDASGVIHTLDSNISEDHARALYELVLREKPTVVLEIGMAHGISTLAILSALQRIGNGKLISIDPNQSTRWKKIGLQLVQECQFENRHNVVEQPDYLALPLLLQENVVVDLAYIDGWHTFDYTLLDFFYIDRMLKSNGIVGFNDCGYPAVKRVLSFVKSHRKYSGVDVGLNRHYSGRNQLAVMVKALLQMPSAEDQYFRKLEAWEPNWDYYARF